MRALPIFLAFIAALGFGEHSGISGKIREALRADVSPDFH
jgi:hypothetical protein